MKIKSLLFATALLPLTAHAQVAVWLSPNDVETASASGISGTSTEQFGQAFGTTPTGVLGNGATYSYIGTPVATIGNNPTLSGFSTGSFLTGKNGSNTTISLSTPAAYFGIYFLAADALNEIVISSGGTTLLTFDTADLLTKLNNGVGTVTAINGNMYNTADYFGKPVNGTVNPTQAYAYLHFIAGAGVTFDKIQLKQRSGVSSAFESDEHSIRTTAPTVPGTLVAVPEPSSLLLSLSTIGSLLLVRKRK